MAMATFPFNLDRWQWNWHYLEGRHWLLFQCLDCPLLNVSASTPGVDASII
jgi:hypothetical protein